MIAFRTLGGNRVWVKPEAIISIIEVPVEKVEGTDEAKCEKMMGVAVFQHGMMWLSVEGGLRLVRELARVAGDEWRVDETVEDEVPE